MTRRFLLFIGLLGGGAVFLLLAEGAEGRELKGEIRLSFFLRAPSWTGNTVTAAWATHASTTGNHQPFVIIERLP